MNLVKWFWGLLEIEKSQVRRPAGMSRRGFLQAIGITTVTVMGGGVLLAKAERRNVFLKEGLLSIADLVEMTLKDLGAPSFVDISINLQQREAMQQLLKKDRLVTATDIMGFKVFDRYKPKALPSIRPVEFGTGDRKKTLYFTK